MRTAQSKRKTNGAAKAPPPPPPAYEHTMPLQTFTASYIRPAIADGMKAALDRLATSISAGMRDDRAAFLHALDKHFGEFMAVVDAVINADREERKADRADRDAFFLAYTPPKRKKKRK